MKPVPGVMTCKRESSRAVTSLLRPPPAGGSPSSSSSIGRRLLSEAAASSSVPSREKCSRERSFFEVAWARMAAKKASATSLVSRRSRVLGEGRRMPDGLVEGQAHEPAQQEVVAELLAEPALGGDGVEDLGELGTQEVFGGDRRTAAPRRRGDRARGSSAQGLCRPGRGWRAGWSSGTTSSSVVRTMNPASRNPCFGAHLNWSRQPRSGKESRRS